MYRLFVVMILACMISSCQQAVEKSQEAIMEAEERCERSSGFPMNLGNRWTYEAIDSINLLNRTIEIAIEDTARISPNIAGQVWSGHFAVNKDSMFSYTCDDTLHLLWFPYEFARYFSIKYPLQEGQEWLLRPNGKIKVRYVGEYSTGNHDFENVYHIILTYDAPNVHGTRELWAVDGVGIVRFKERSSVGGFNPIYSVGELTSWNLIGE